jgi:ABC-type nitrate/sulfonate/bicarbonate transport system permease component
MIKYQNIINNIYPFLGVIFLLVIWQLASNFSLVPVYMLPSPIMVVNALVNSFSELMWHLKITLTEAFIGFFVSVFLAVLIAIVMNNYSIVYKILYPILVITQTIPMVAIGPLLVLWMGYGIAPKITLIIIICFFPLTVGLLNGFKTVDKDAVNLLKVMGCTKTQLYRHILIPSSMTVFMPTLKIAASYSIMGAVVAEWLGGDAGLGVYMTRVRKSFAFDKMFAVILIIMITSLLIIWLVTLLEKKILKWKNI